MEAMHAPDVTGEGPPAEEPLRPLRADAQRNRARVLEAAESVFAAEGINVPVDVIAEKAGVGIGTLYRHFPTKEKLFEAILIGRIGDITVDALARVDSEDPGAAFFGFLQDLVEETSSKRDLIQALLGAGVQVEEAVAETKQGLEAAVGELLHVAQRAGAVRSDVTTSVVLSLVGATCMAAEHPPKSATPREMLNIVCDGLRPPNVARPTRPPHGAT
jgi:AcrR family transcriptional regulator